MFPTQILLQSARRRLLPQQLRSLDISRYYVFQTNDEQIAASATISPQGNTNPGHTATVCLMKGRPWAANYGKLCVLIDEDKLPGALKRQPPEFEYPHDIPASVGDYATYEDMVLAGIARK